MSHLKTKDVTMQGRISHEAERENLQSLKILAKRHLDPPSRSATIHPTTKQHF